MMVVLHCARAECGGQRVPGGGGGDAGVRDHDGGCDGDGGGGDPAGVQQREGILSGQRRIHLPRRQVHQEGRPPLRLHRRER